MVDNFYFSIFLRERKFLGLESERGGSIYWPNTKIIDFDDPSAIGISDMPPK